MAIAEAIHEFLLQRLTEARDADESLRLEEARMEAAALVTAARQEVAARRAIRDRQVCGMSRSALRRSDP